MSRKKKYIPKKWESQAFGDPNMRYTDVFGKKRTDSFCMVFSSLLESAAYRDLKDRQKNIYLLCLSQCYGHRKPGKDYPDIEEFRGESVFYLNWREVHQRYGMYSEGNHSRFYRDMDVLEEHGFIRQITSGKSQHRKSVWELRGEWQTWQPS